MTDYQDFITNRQHSRNTYGFTPQCLPSFLFDFQRDLVSWATEQGRCAIFADCGMGKTPMQLVWAQNVVEKTNRRVLILTPLAVAHQTVEEATKFGITVTRSHKGELQDGIVVANYDRLHHFNPNDFAGVVCDESSILKSFAGKTRQALTEFLRKMPYRLLTTATAAPNDYVELGTTSEALGQMGHMDMLNRFFKNDQNNSATGRIYGDQIKWRLKGHAEVPFWRWVTTWARAIRKPSDLGYPDGDFILPPLVENEHLIEVSSPPEGMLFTLPAVGLKEQRDERRRSIEDRCRKVSDLVAHDQPALIWCHLNPEGDLLEKMIPGAVQVSGKDSDEQKEEKFLDFAHGRTRVLITKPKIGAWGLNFQHCAHVTVFPSHSFEQYYQGVRRCWRFGQVRPVVVDIVTTEGERNVLKNLRRKSAQADTMFAHLVREMTKATAIEADTSHTLTPEIPAWL